MDGKVIYRVAETYEGSGICQIAHQHSCNMVGGWRQVIMNPQKKGLHPILAQAVKIEGEKDPYNPPRPDEIYRRIVEKFLHNVDTLFPTDCVGIVWNKVMTYWSGLRLAVEYAVGGIP